MKKDLQNIIITFGLISLCFTQGSLFYRKVIAEEAHAEIINAMKSEIEQNLALVREEEIQQRATALAREMLNKQQSVSVNENVGEDNGLLERAIAAANAQAELQKQQVALGSQVEQASTPQAAPVTKVTIKPSRHSSAS